MRVSRLDLGQKSLRSPFNPNMTSYSIKKSSLPSKPRRARLLPILLKSPRRATLGIIPRALLKLTLAI